EVKQPKSATQEKQKLTSTKEEIQNHGTKSNNILNQTESITSKNQQCLEPENLKGTLHNNQNVRRLNQKFSSWKEQDHTVKVQKAQLQKNSSQTDKGLEKEKTEISDSKAQDHPTQVKNSSGPISDPVSTTPSEPLNETNTSPSHGNQSKYKTQMFVSSQSDSSAVSPKEKKELLNKKEPENFQAQNEEKTETPKQHNEGNKLTSTGVDKIKVSTTEIQEVKHPKNATQEKQKVTSTKEENQNHGTTSNNILNQTESITSNSQKQSISSKNQQCLESDSVKGTLHNNQNVRRLNQKFSSWKEEDHTVKVQKAQLQKFSSQTEKRLEEEKAEISDSKAQDHPTQGKNSSGPISDPVSTTPSEPQNETNTSPSQSKYKTQVFV
ncbi:hypothetical protein AB205_0180620, partial [Aquarana catesbeiana]